MDGGFKHDVETMEAWAGWLKQRHKPEPPTEAVWLSTYLLEDVLERVQKNPGIVWYHQRAIAEKLEELGGVDVYYSGGRNPEEATADDGPIALSAAPRSGHTQGKNLQVEWGRNYILSPSSNATLWEQLLGRTHRPGQPRDTVEAVVYTHTDPLKDAVSRAKADAQAKQEREGQRQKLLYADWHLTD